MKLATAYDISHRATAVPSLRLCVVLLAGLTVLRLVGLHFSIVDLYIDESQYWAWSREPAFGYFSKPPLLAWIIAASELVCGSSESCARAPAPIFYFGTSLVCYAIAKVLYDERTAFWTALTVALAIGVVFSSRIISTDVPLLFFWAVALLAYVKLLRAPSSRARLWAIVLGVSLGLGLLAKYAMVYFVLCMAVAALIDDDARFIWRRPYVWLALGIAALCLVPNLVWNADNGFATFRHTADNAEGSGLSFSPAKGFEFLASQFAVFGPIVFGALLIVTLHFRRPDISREDRLMLAFSLPVLALITVVAFISGAIVVAAALVRTKAWHWMYASLAIGVVAQAVLLVTDTMADRIKVPYIAKPDVYERTMGWRSLGEETLRFAARAGAKTIVGDGRDIVASLIYYLRHDPRPVLTWQRRNVPADHFDLTRPLTPTAPEPVLFVTSCANGERLKASFRDVEPLGTFETPTGPTSKRDYHVFKLSGGRDPTQPLPYCG
jgi:dolichyl-phosphate-mannose-protein mannosyltransferase